MRRAGLAVLGLAWLLACGASTRKLDEASLYEGPQFKLKVARYYQNLPFHFVGEVFSVQCGSAGTAGSPGHTTQDPGWVTLAAGAALGSRSAAELVERERAHFRGVDDATLVWIGSGLQVSFDACGEIRSWYPWELPSELIDPAEKPPYCKPTGNVDCRKDDFEGDRAARFDEIRVAPAEGTLSFVARSSALKNARGVRVTSADRGRTWKAEPL
jgi:hypothetical protein